MLISIFALSLASHTFAVPCEHVCSSFVPEGPTSLTPEELRIEPCQGTPGEKCFGTDVFFGDSDVSIWADTMPVPESDGPTSYVLICLFLLAISSAFVYALTALFKDLKEAKIQLKIAEARRDAAMFALVDREEARDRLEHFKLNLPEENNFS